MASGRKLKILVVDDEEIVRNCICGLLSYEGHEVQTAVNAEAALELFNKSEFDMIFVDYAMPGMKGDELAALIKARAPHQPIIMITGNAPLPKSMPAVDLVISKPVMLDDLKNAIAKISDERSFAE